jgi:hypothetical protein
VLVELDDSSLSIRAEPRADPGGCEVSYEYRVEVVETGSEVRLAIWSTALPSTTPPPGVRIACTGFTGPAGPLTATLESPLGARRVVDEAGGPLRPVRRRELLVPVPLPDGWVAAEEQFGSTAAGATSWRRFQPQPLTVMVYGLDVWMTWGADCRAVFDPMIGGSAITPVVVRGVDAQRTHDTRGPMLFWEEGDACVQLWGMGSCNAAGCQAIDTAQIAALAESLRAPGAGS